MVFWQQQQPAVMPFLGCKIGEILIMEKNAVVLIWLESGVEFWIYNVLDLL